MVNIPTISQKSEKIESESDTSTEVKIKDKAFLSDLEKEFVRSRLTSYLRSHGGKANQELVFSISRKLKL